MTRATKPRSAKPASVYTARVVGPDGREIVPGTPEAERLSEGVTRLWAEAVAAERDVQQQTAGEVASQ